MGQGDAGRTWYPAEPALRAGSLTDEVLNGGDSKPHSLHFLICRSGKILPQNNSQLYKI